MKVEQIAVHRCHPEGVKGHQQSSILPVLDAWYAFLRPLATIYLFEASAGQGDLVVNLRKSLCKVLKDFPQYAGTLEPCSPEVEGSAGRYARTRVVWGGAEEPGVEFIEARTRARLENLLSPSVEKTTPFLWDRSAASLRSLFPGPLGATSAMRVQVTAFACGGFSLGVDVDHGLADAHAVGFLMGYWSATFNRYFYLEAPSMSPTLPEVLWHPNFLDDQVASLVKRDGSERVLERARGLPTRRPDFRSIMPVDHLGPEKLDSSAILAKAIKSTMGVLCMLHMPQWLCDRVVGRVQDAAGETQITQQIAIMSFLWAALSRARKSRGQDAIELHVPSSLRYRLGLPQGLLGSPVFAPMISPDTEGGDGTDAAKLAAGITKTLARYDEDGMLSIIHDASMRDSPTKLSMPRNESMQFTSAVIPAADRLAFGSSSLTFVSPVLPMDHVFVMLGGMDGAGGFGKKWNDEGVDVFFSTPQDILDSMLTDPAFADFEKLVEI